MPIQDSLLSLPRRLESRLQRLLVESLVVRRRRRFGARIDEVLRLDEGALGGLGEGREEDERALPGFRALRRSGHHRYMLGRYLAVAPLVDGKRVLEVGSGLGWGSYLIERCARELVCLDTSREALQFARTTWQYGHHVSLVERSALDLAGLGAPFDLVLAFELIEHLGLEGARAFLAETARCLRPGGKLVLTSYFAPRPTYARREERKNPFHLHVFTRDEVRDELLRAGFDDVHLQGTFLAVARRPAR